MENRRTFLKKSFIACAAVSVTVCSTAPKAFSDRPFKTTSPQRGLVLWYSQTGHTQRIGKLVASKWKQLGLRVDCMDYRQIDRASLSQYDVIAAGVPVFYGDVPKNVQAWLHTLPDLNGTAVNAFVTFGGPGGSEHNTASTLLSLLADKGGVPTGLETFGNMSTFAPTWSYGNEKRILKYKHLPDATTYTQTRQYAAQIIDRIKQAAPITIQRHWGIDELLKHLPQAWGTKLLIGKHTVDKSRCIACGVCVNTCPADAIDPYKPHVSGDRCLVCLGCVNNCPQQAVDMTFMGKNVYGFTTFLKHHQITIQEPDERS